MLSGADSLARTYATERDKVNCPFYSKIGACRHGESCSRIHNKPTFSQTILLSHLYMNPKAKRADKDKPRSDADQEREDQRHFDEFYEDIFLEFMKYGKIDQIVVFDNISDHMVGHTFVKYTDEDEAEVALEALQGRWYNQRPIVAELSPVTDFAEARCKQSGKASCGRGGYCNFAHFHSISNHLKDELYSIQDDYWKKRKTGVYPEPQRA
ncbi:hypothetical protein RCL1_004022 [Eukaryota sp. TZLM3-RCL]